MTPPGKVRVLVHPDDAPRYRAAAERIAPGAFDVLASPKVTRGEVWGFDLDELARHFDDVLASRPARDH